MLRLLLAALAAVPARAYAPQPGTSAFAVALGPAAYSVAVDPAVQEGRILVRRLGLDGGVLWEGRWGSGRNEAPIEGAVTLGGSVVVIGDSSAGCFAARWSHDGRLLWSQDLLLGEECHSRTIVVDADNDSYVLATTAQSGVFAATVWKIDKRGQVEWSYRDSRNAPDYAFALEHSANGDVLTVTTVRHDGPRWRYDTLALDGRGALVPLLRY